MMPRTSGGDRRIETYALTTADSRWPGLLRSARHDSYHLPEYLEFAAQRQVVGTPVALVAQDGDEHLILPLIERTIADEDGQPVGVVDAVSPRGYPGPISSHGPDAAVDGFVDRAISALIDLMRERSIVSSFIRLHPLLSPPPGLLERHGEIVDHGDSVSIDLGHSTDELWGHIRQNHRRDISRAMRQGYRTRLDDGWERFDEFTQAYAAAMERLQAAPEWHLDAEYFRAYRAAMGDRLHLYVAEIDGAFAAGSLLTETDGIVEYHYAATAGEHRAASPSKLIIRDACTWARDRGNRTFHLAGSSQRDDSLHRFKLGFSSRSHAVCSWRIIADTASYRSLVAQWRQRWSPGVEPTEGYFPAYRSVGPEDNTDPARCHAPLEEVGKSP